MFGLPRPLAGALIGIAGFLLATLPLKILFRNSLAVYFILFDLELPGRLTISALSSYANIDLPQLATGIATTGISLIPPGILGWLLGSGRRSTHTIGTVLGAIYLCGILAIGSVLILMAL